MKLTLSFYRAKTSRPCPRGQILRKGFTREAFTRSDGTRIKATRVKPGCIKDRGEPGKGPKTLPTPVEGSLEGWKKDMPRKKRHALLKRLTKKENCRSVIGRLTLLRNISDDPATDRVAEADAKWLHKQPFCKLKSKEKK